MEPSPPSTPSGDVPAEFPVDPLDSMVEEFVRRLESDGEVDLERFCASAPSALQSALRERCADVLVLRRVLPAPLAAQAPHPPAAGQLLGDFRLLSEIGRGAMGVVYLARQVSLRRVVALKVLYPHLSGLERSLERFRREARSAAKLRHPGICPVYAVGEEGGLHFFAMAYVDGRNLSEEIDLVRKRRAEQRLPGPDERLAIDPQRSYEAQVAELVANVAEALHYAHGQGVVHRDVKPQNILIGRDGRAYLADFGLAKDRDDPALSRTGEVAGTLYYMSPEQAAGRRDELDARSDVFSLGVVLYELLTLRRPFEGSSSQQLLLRIATATPSPVRELNPQAPRDLQTICLHALEKLPHKRYADAHEFALDLRRFLGHQSIVARPPSTAELLSRRIAQHRRVLGAAAIAVLGTSALSWFRSDLQARESARDALAELAHLDVDRALADSDAHTLRTALELAARANTASLAPQQREAVERVLRIPSEAIAPRVERALAEIAAVRAGQVEELADAPWREFSPQSADDRARLMQAFDVLRLAALAPGAERDDALSAARLTTASPRLSVRTPQPGARVSLRRMSVEGLQPPQFVGVTPLEKLPVDPGAYRVVVEGPDGALAELTRLFDRLYHDFELSAHPRSVSEVNANMVRIEAGPIRYRELEDGEQGLRDGVLERAFWIERFEVSNADYKRFTDETGHPPPLYWADFEFERIADLPVSAVRWSDAILYAEWSGKRLPTALEWQVAARGAEGRLFPWGDEREQWSSLADLPAAEQGRPARYVEHASPVASRSEGRGPHGLLHSLDNVAEWCADFSRTLSARPALLYDFAINAGGSYTSEPSSATLGLLGANETDKLMLHVGLRCAKSESP